MNHILKGDHGKRIVVIENEFGEIDIDSELVAFQDNGEEDIMLLNKAACAAPCAEIWSIC